jgi:hypothetical protein
MNCCDDTPAGLDCNQGRNCPVRREMLNDTRQQRRSDFVGALLIVSAICCVLAIIILYARM